MQFIMEHYPFITKASHSEIALEEKDYGVIGALSRQ